MTAYIPADRVLATPMDPDRNDAGAATIGEYLVKLLAELWHKQEEFSGKRPFGNSSWDWDLYMALVDAELITGSYDEDGCLDDADVETGFTLIEQAIERLGALSE